MVVVITGPIASGKSTVARELARELDRTRGRVAVLDLDLLHEMVTAGRPVSDDADWTLARHAAAALANMLLDEGTAVVIAEGSFNRPTDRAALARHITAPILYVTLGVSFEEALRRTRADPTRGRSRDPSFLGPYFAAVSEVLESVPETDIVIATEQTTARSAALAIAKFVPDL